MIEHHAVLVRVSSIDSYIAPTVSEDVSFEEIKKDQIGIADVRELIEKANRTPFGSASSQLLIVVTSFITVEAQQALLKIIEEPPQTTRFLFVLPASFLLLPTLMSRFAVETTTEVTCDQEPFEEFLQAPLAARMSEIEKVSKSKNQVWQSAIKCGLLEHLKKDSRKYSRNQLEVLQFVASTLLSRGASNKILLEQLALTL